MFEKKKINYSIRACGYVRKSRKTKHYGLSMGQPLTEEEEIKADLARQESLIRQLADREGVMLTHIFREVVSGESLQDRPEATAMLKGVWEGKWDAIFTTEIERLGRGSQGDQGRIVSALRHSSQMSPEGTRVVTLAKTYFPNNEGDMEYIEFGLFMSARELNTIKRRLNYGKINSVLNGEFIATDNPYGYDKIVIDGCKTLKPNKDSKVVKLIYDMVASAHSSYKVADWLNEMLIPSPNGVGWTSTTVRKIIHNDVYLGYVSYGKCKVFAEVDDELNVRKKRKYSKDYVKVDGLHEAIIEEKFAEYARAQLGNNLPLPNNKQLRNPYAGLIHCSNCGANLSIAYNKRTGEDRLIHRSYNGPCNSPSVCFDNVAEEVVKILCKKRKNIEARLDRYNCKLEQQSKMQRISKLKKMLNYYDESLNNAFDLLDRGVISEGEFTLRRDYIAKQKKSAKVAIENIETKDVHAVLLNQKTWILKLLQSLERNESVSEINRVARMCIKDIEVSVEGCRYTNYPTFKVSVELKSKW